MSVFKHLIFAFFLGLMAFQTQASTAGKAKIERVELKGSETTRQMIVELNGRLTGNPALTVRDQMVQVEVPNSYVWPRIEKKSTISKQNDTTLMAYQFEQDVVRVRAMLPFSLKGQEDRVSVVVRDGVIVLNFPTPTPARKEVAAAPTAPVRETPKGEARTVKAEASRSADAQAEEALIMNLVHGSDFEEPAQPILEDQVRLQASAPERAQGESNFSLTNYIVKFLAFLGLVLVLFYGVVSLMRKGVLKKGSLGFLNSTKVVEVLNTTHLGPKRSMMLVKAHNQVFLVGSSEQGLNLISEIKDVSGLFKEGEKEISGSNFDSTLNTAQTYTKDFKLKDEILTSAPEGEGKAPTSGLSELLNEKPVQDTVKLSDQIKNKVKGLKSLQ
jgi:flagellar biogenesis protein FliO